MTTALNDFVDKISKIEIGDLKCYLNIEKR